MPSPYVTLGNRPLDQWKVTELKEELKRRKLTIRGLKEDLVKRLDEAVRLEWESAKENTDNSLREIDQSELPTEQATTESIVSGNAEDFMGVGINMIEKIDGNPDFGIDDDRMLLVETKFVEAVDIGHEINAVELVGEQVSESSAVEATVVASETVEFLNPLSETNLHSYGTNHDENLPGGLDHDLLEHPPEFSDPNAQLPHIEESSLCELPPNIPSFQGSEIQNAAEDPMVQLGNDDSKCSQPDQSIQPLIYQVPEVDEVIFNSISTECVPLIEKNEVKVDVVTDCVKLERDIDHEMYPPHGNVVPDGGKSHPRDVEKPLDEKVSANETCNRNYKIVNSPKNIDCGDLGSEKLSLDDDSMEEDILESKQMEDKSVSNQTGDGVEKSEVLTLEEDNIVDVVGHDKPVETKFAITENQIVTAQTSVKRKFTDKEAVRNNDTKKKPRTWNVEGLRDSEPQSGGFKVPTMPMNSSQDSQTTIKYLSRSDSTVNEATKQNLDPPSTRAPSNSLRVDRFLRPFTLKAVQELLGKTGKVTNFWMDNIKTHCYVSYSSVEEAVETRNALYNLQWPTNGGRLLVADFVDPQEVKTRVEAPTQSPATNVAPTFSAAQTHPTMQPQPSPRPQDQRQQLPNTFLPPAPMTNAPPVRERPQPTKEPQSREQQLPTRDRVNLPPPPPLTENPDPPIVTLDDLFRKTTATPRIYYLPLSDELVAAKLKAQGKND